MKTIDDITTDAVMAALESIDKDLTGTKHSAGPCGDALANKLHEVIEAAVAKHLSASEV